MAHAEICPVCEGIGRIKELNDGTINKIELSLPINARVCHGCDGKGWVTVEDEVVEKMESEKKVKTWVTCPRCKTEHSLPSYHQAGDHVDCPRCHHPYIPFG